ncbi:MAG: hypothetical protein QF662_02405 [Phycisphaerae bacterium]|jgi:alpha-galactosidase|nr:hypothetical protein [Phycisphaerae bacterium]
MDKFVLIGAGSAAFTRGLISDLIRSGKPAEVALVDINPEALAVAEGLVRKLVEATGAKITLEAATDRRDVLGGATVVITTIAVGGRRAWGQDVFIPRKYGIYQPVGDTTMPGGISRAMRMIPPMVAIAEDVMDLCPDAWFFNYSNPMTAICRAIRKTTLARVVGLCHGTWHVSTMLAGLAGLDPKQCQFDAVGLNHLTWITEMTCDGRDVLAELRTAAAKQIRARHQADAHGEALAETGIGEDASKSIAESPFTWEMFTRFGAFPAVLDRHITEFFPSMFPHGNHYGKTLGMNEWNLEAKLKSGDEGYAEMKRLGLGPDPLPKDYFDASGGEHEQVIDIVDSIATGAGRVYAANLPNGGRVENLPDEAVVETMATVDDAGFHPWDYGRIDDAIAATLLPHIAKVEVVVEAALAGNRDKFVEALILDGSCPSVRDAGLLADELLAAHSEHLPLFQR